MRARQCHNIMPLLEDRQERIDNVIPEQAAARAAWLVGVCKATAEEFYMQWHLSEPPPIAFHHLHATILAMPPEWKRVWLWLEKKACARKVNVYQANLRAICNHYRIWLEITRGSIRDCDKVSAAQLEDICHLQQPCHHAGRQCFS